MSIDHIIEPETKVMDGAVIRANLRAKAELLPLVSTGDRNRAAMSSEWNPFQPGEGLSMHLAADHAILEAQHKKPLLVRDIVRDAVYEQIVSNPHEFMTALIQDQFSQDPYYHAQTRGRFATHVERLRRWWHS